MKNYEIEGTETPNLKPATTMQIGEIAWLPQMQASGYEGYILRTYSGYVLLGNPAITWTALPGLPDVLVRELPSGTKITLVIK